MVVTHEQPTPMLCSGYLFLMVENLLPTTNNSSITNPIELPTIGESVADIDMLVPTNSDSIALSLLIGPPYNYWGDDDGDGQGDDGITVTGNLMLAISDKYNQTVARNEVLTVCRSPYKLTLSNTEGALQTRYGVPNESLLSQRNVTYYVQPKASPSVCFARPNLNAGTGLTLVLLGFGTLIRGFSHNPFRRMV